MPASAARTTTRSTRCATATSLPSPAVVTDGVPRFVGRSRNTPGAIKNVRVIEYRIPQDYSGAAH